MTATTRTSTQSPVTTASFVGMDLGDPIGPAPFVELLRQFGTDRTAAVAAIRIGFPALLLKDAGPTSLCRHSAYWPSYACRLPRPTCCPGMARCLTQRHRGVFRHDDTAHNGYNRRRQLMHDRNALTPVPARIRQGSGN